MAGTGKKWAMGCGIGCGVMLLIGALIVGGGIFAGKRIANRAEGLDASFEQLTDTYGQVDEYTPPIDGTIEAGRMEVFLAARDDMAPLRMEMSDHFSVLDGKKGGVLDKIKAGIRLVPSLFDFIEQRNEALLEAGMGVGEYQYIYGLAYYAMLGVDPADGPGFTVFSDDEEEDQDHAFGFTSRAGSDDEEDVRETREREVRRAVNRMQVAMARNQLAALDEFYGDLDGVDRETWRAQLAAEVEAMESEHLKLLWEDGLPPQTEASLRPFRERLAATYDAMISILEMGLADND